MLVRRWDLAQPLPKAERTPEGFLRAPATKLARTGVQEYTREDGTVQRELRLETEVFAEPSLSSLNGKPVTHNHPGRVDASNARQHMRGVAISPRRDGDFVVADLQIHDAKMIEAAERGDSEISLGYDTELVAIPGGVFRQDGHPLNGTRADYLQTKIAHNHVALLPRGRANEGMADRPVRLRLDSSGAQLAAEVLMKFKLPSGKEVEVSEEASKDLTEAFSALTKKVEETEARADAAEKKLSVENDDEAKAKKAAADAARFDLMKRASAQLKLDAAELVKLSDAEIKKRLALALDPQLKLDGKSDEYVSAYLDAMTARPNPAAQLAKAITNTAVQRTDADEESPYAKAIRERSERQNKLNGKN